MSLMTNGLIVMPKTFRVMFGPNGMTANPIMAGTMARIGARVNMTLFAPAGTMSSLKNNLRPSAIGWRMSIGADFHRAHAILHPAEHFPLGQGQDHDRQHHHAHHRRYLGERNRKSQA